MITAVVKVDLKGLENFKKDVLEQLESATTGPVHDALILWAFRYRSYLQLRFDVYSKGGGDWKPLADSTIARRRKGSKSNLAKLRKLQSSAGKPQTKKGAVAILRDTGLLFAALNPVYAGNPGAIQEKIKFGIRVGYGGPHKHVDKAGKTSKVSIADIAKFHQNGAIPHLPQRKIIVAPSQSLISAMARDMKNALDEIARK